MDASRIAELLAPFLSPYRSGVPPNRGCHSEERSDEPPAILSPAQLRYISIYIDILLRWNARINLTAIRDPEKIVTRHFGESLFAARHLFPLGKEDIEKEIGMPHFSPLLREVGSAADKGQPNAERLREITLADIGSGAGFPGIPIKLWAPEISLTLIESNHKKATFLREVARVLTLTDIDIQSVRAESLPPHSFDLVTLRAVERFEAILPIAARLLTPTGRLALLIGSSQLPAAQAILPASIWSQPVPIPKSSSRVLAFADRT